MLSFSASAYDSYPFAYGRPRTFPLSKLSSYSCFLVSILLANSIVRVSFIVSLTDASMFISRSSDLSDTFCWLSSRVSGCASSSL